MFEVSDVQGNSCYVQDKELAEDIVKDKDTPFVKVVECDEDVRDEHIIKTMSDFMLYFY